MMNDLGLLDQPLNHSTTIVLYFRLQTRDLLSMSSMKSPDMVFSSLVFLVKVNRKTVGVRTGF